MDRTRTSRIGRGESRLLIRREALLHNAELIRSRLAPGTQIYAVVKANGYGHGASIVADTLCHYAIADDTEPPIHRVVVATIDEASALPEISRPITILQPIESPSSARTRKARPRNPQRLDADTNQPPPPMISSASPSDWQTSPSCRSWSTPA